MLHLRSTVSGLQRSEWVLHGSPVQVQAPEAVEQGERVRYRFQAWSDGETPFQARNAIASLKPMTLEAKWVKVNGLVDRPVELKAIYELQVAATVNAPHELLSRVMEIAFQHD